jgi:quercetin dioxygenase-like cupin family protein
MHGFIKTTRTRAIIRHAAGAAALALAACVAPGLAMAGTCPAGKSGVNVRAPVSTPASGVTDTVIASIDVAKEPAHIEGRLFRMRRLVIQPGGVVPWHSHGDRPAIIYIISGTVEEYASTCAAPIVHPAGDVTTETSGTSHWWKNTGKKTVVLLSADLFPVKADPDTM